MRIAILTAFSEMREGHSIYQVVRSQATTLLRYGHDVVVFAAEDCPESRLHLPGGHECPVVSKFSNRVSGQWQSLSELSDDDKECTELLAEQVRDCLQGFHVAFTHDWISSHWLLPFAEALRNVSPRTRDVRFYLRSGSGTEEHSLNDGLLTTDPADDGVDHITHDPDEPIPSIAFRNADIRRGEQMMLTYTTDPLE